MRGEVVWGGERPVRRLIGACVTPSFLFLTGYSSRRVQSPSSKSNDTLSGISSIEPSKRSGSSHSLASVRTGEDGRVPGCLPQPQAQSAATESGSVSSQGPMDW